MNIVIEPYIRQKVHWPHEGRHILAQYNETSIYVYQAYRPTIAKYAVEHQRFGEGFSYTRMSWIKPNFLWMMYRSGWAEKLGQECILAIRLSRIFFDALLERAVWSSFNPKYVTYDKWKREVAQSQIRLQWDPDHEPSGKQTKRRAIQLGLRGGPLREYAEKQIEEIIDLTPFVVEQRLNLEKENSLLVPQERVYHPNSQKAIQNIELDV